MNFSVHAVHIPHNPKDPSQTASLIPTSAFSEEISRKVQHFHESFPGYTPTPLQSLPALASKLGVSSLWVKDESRRFDLNAFKVLGGSYAIGSCIADLLETDIEDLTYEMLLSEKVHEKIKDVTFITATDGNHGRGVAWTANRLGAHCVVYMPRGTAPERLENIQKLGADASITDLVYDDAVRKAKADAEKNGWILIQDTAWEGYEETPLRIMQGYTTLGAEISAQLGALRPTHLFLQAGVGSMAAAVTAFFTEIYGSCRPEIIIVEPEDADCLYQTALANDGKLHFTEGGMQSIMAGLCCGEPCPPAWDILRDHADHFISMPDFIAAQGMRILGNPLPGDPVITSGESGASAFGLAMELLRNPALRSLKEQLHITADSRLLFISTEGDTDRENYRRILWDGAFPHP